MLLVFRYCLEKLFMKRWFERLLKYVSDSIDESFDDFVGSHKVLLLKSLSRVPEPINFLDWVIKNEFGIIDSVSNEFFTSHRCCFAILRFFSILKLKNIGYCSVLKVL